MKLTILLIGILTIAMLVISCAPAAEQVEPTAETIEETQDTTEETPDAIEETSPDTTAKIETTTTADTTTTTTDAKTSATTTATETEATTTTTAQYDSDLKKLMDKGKVTDNYQFRFRSVIKDEFGNYDTSMEYDIFVNGNKVKKYFITPQKFSGESFDNIYLDTYAKTATGTCDAGNVACNDRRKRIYPTNYDSVALTISPKTVIEKITPAIKITGTQVYDGRKVNVYEFKDSEGWLHTFLIENYYGLPIHYTVHSFDGNEQVLEEEYQFTKLSVNSVKDSNVNPPSDYIKVE